VEKHQALDPRVAYLLTNMMEEVMRSGTAAGLRGRSGFNAPAAGKTGTSQGERDGWFAGYTTELLCIVWVGFDDNRELNLEGAHSAAPVWGEFMKRALQYRDYAGAKPFAMPDGIVTVQIDPLSGMPATPMCPETTAEVYIAGTQPVGSCPLHGAGQPGMTNVAGWDNSRPVEVVTPGSTAPRITGGDHPVSAQRRGAPAAEQPTTVQAEKHPDEQKDEKKGFFRRLWGVFK
jgi:penicillin-binding protein 1B